MISSMNLQLAGLGQDKTQIKGHDTELWAMGQERDMIFRVDRQLVGLGRE